MRLRAAAITPFTSSRIGCSGSTCPTSGVWDKHCSNAVISRHLLAGTCGLGADRGGFQHTQIVVANVAQGLRNSHSANKAVRANDGNGGRVLAEPVLQTVLHVTNTYHAIHNFPLITHLYSRNRLDKGGTQRLPRSNLLLTQAPGGVCAPGDDGERSEEHTSELQSRPHLVCRLLLEKKKKRSC